MDLNLFYFITTLYLPTLEWEVSLVEYSLASESEIL